MAKGSKVINIGKVHLVYKGEAYGTDDGRVTDHQIDKNLAARKNKTLSKAVAAYAEVLNDDLTLAYRCQVMAASEIKEEVRAAKAKGKPLTDRRLKNIVKSKAVLATELHILEPDGAPLEAVFRFRSLLLGRLLVALSVAALAAQVVLLLTAGGRGGDWPVFSDTSGLIFSLSLIAYIPVIFHAIAWLLDLSHEIKHSRDLDLHIPLPSHFLITLAVIVVADMTYLLFDGSGNFGIWLFAVTLRVVGTLTWVLLVGRFFQGVGRLLGFSQSASFGLSLIFILLPMLAHVPIICLQRRLNLLDGSKADLTVGQ